MLYTSRRKACIAAWFLSLAIWIFPTLLSAGFEGFGTSTSGGQHGPLVVVTSLANAGPGTLRAALANGNSQRIIFAVGGIIHLHKALELRGRSFMTIDGSTAPPPGITLRGQGLVIRNSHDIVVTHIRVRNPLKVGILVWDGSSNVVIDHCSVTNGGDENMGITEDTRNITVSWCLIGDSRPNSFDLHTKGMLIANFKKPAVTNISLHHNLFINESQRSPQISTAGLFDMRNNVIRNWRAYGIRIRHGAFGNIVNNVFATQIKPRAAIILTDTAGPVYIQGNRGPGNANVNAFSTAVIPFPVASVSTDPVTQGDPKVLKGVGAFPRDVIDAALVGSSR